MQRIGRGFCVWIGSNQKPFTVTNAYKMIAQANFDMNSWERIWKLQIPQRARWFLWLTMRNRLLTNQERRRRHLSPELCAIFVERTKRPSFMLDATVILQSLSDQDLFPLKVNKVSFPWIWLKGGWMELIIDMGAGSALQAELLVVWEGLNIAWQRGYRKVMVESDNDVMVQLMSGNSMERCSPSLVRNIQEFYRRSWEVEVVKISLEANKAADFMSKVGIILSDSPQQDEFLFLFLTDSFANLMAFTFCAESFKLSPAATSLADRDLDRDVDLTRSFLLTCSPSISIAP
ncbi:hypothetical protein PVK06_036602 [Gossypium arboreum]|uniref:RNase H type-1 domain-containing protein n=1 Tax=Gossypium arboreum TaxID=29729 RepID=A0ABR0NKC2_GOSAR|nr:hypothetical protein PVK06_036602 [Gossypium arboreum]